MLAIALAVACSRYIYNGVIVHAHPVRGELHNQRNATENTTERGFTVGVLTATCEESFCSVVRTLTPQGRTQGGVVVKTPSLNLLCYKNVITYAKEFVYVFVHFLLV